MASFNKTITAAFGADRGRNIPRRMCAIIAKLGRSFRAFITTTTCARIGRKSPRSRQHRPHRLCGREPLWIAGKFQTVRRLTDLSWGHHANVARRASRRDPNALRKLARTVRVSRASPRKNNSSPHGSLAGTLCEAMEAPVKVIDLFSVLPAVTNGWMFAAFVVAVVVWWIAPASRR